MTYIIAYRWNDEARIEKWYSLKDAIKRWDRLNYLGIQASIHTLR